MVVKSKKREILIRDELIMKRWREYFKELFCETDGRLAYGLKKVLKKNSLKKIDSETITIE